MSRKEIKPRKKTHPPHPKRIEAKKAPAIGPGEKGPQHPSVLVLGASSFIGRRLMAELGAQATGTYCRRPMARSVYFNALTMSLDPILDGLPGITHAVILLGITKLNDCDMRPEAVATLNVTATTRCIDALIRRNIVPVFASSNMVFDGQRGDYLERNPTNPIIAYGRQKRAVEHYILRSTKHGMIFRFDKICGDTPHDNSLFTSWVDWLIKGRTRVKCASDQVFSPVFAGDAIWAIVNGIQKGLSGIYHVAGPYKHTRTELFQMLRDSINPYIAPIEPAIPCSINEFATENRPMNISMNIDKLKSATGYSPLHMMDLCHSIVENYATIGELRKR